MLTPHFVLHRLNAHALEGEWRRNAIPDDFHNAIHRAQSALNDALGCGAIQKEFIA